MLRYVVHESWRLLSKRISRVSVSFFQLREINLWEKEQLKDDFVKVNSQHCVPTINDNGFILWESRAIAIYLVEKNHPEGHTLYPVDATRRALINQRLQFDAGTLYPRIRAICVSIVYRRTYEFLWIKWIDQFPALFLGETKISDEKREKLNEALEWVNLFLEGNQYVAGGDSPTLADLSILVSVTTIVVRITPSLNECK